MSQSSDEPGVIACRICGRTVARDHSYVVRIEVFADPSMPAMSGDELAGTDFGQTMAELIAELQTLDVEEAQDQVHRAFEYRLCRACQMGFLANPLGLPRPPRRSSGN